MFGHTEPFDEQYHCYSGAFADKPQLEGGDKILLPASAFEQLARLQISYPMLFELRTQSGKRTHCGVLDFVAEDGAIGLPPKTMLSLVRGDPDLAPALEAAAGRRVWVGESWPFGANRGSS